MISSYTAVGLSFLILVYVWFKHFTHSPLSVIRGPRSPSFIFGNLLELFQRPVGEAEFAWQNLYGNIVRTKGILGEDRILIADPKALQKMLHTAGYSYSKLPSLRTISRLINGEGVLWAEGEVHKRQRSVLHPGFGLKESKELLPTFRECAEAISMKWLENIGDSNDQCVVNVSAWLSRGALDAIGQGVFDIRFGTTKDALHPLVKRYSNFFGDVFGLSPASHIFAQAASKYVPMFILQWIVNHAPFSRLVRARNANDTATTIAKELVREKAHALLQGKGNRDIFTLLVKANMDADARNKLSEEELLGQIRTVIAAAHETTANSASWMLLEIARHPKIQSRLRDEIRNTKAAIQGRDDPQLTARDLEGMTYLNAVIKEGLRFHSIAPIIHRIALRDDILPLSKPILTESGDKINEIHVPKGTHIMIAVAMYHRDKDIWGEDAHEFNPDRWLNATLDEKKSTNIGVYSNLLTFLSGHRACLGWRFSIIEIQTFLWELVGKFEFTMTDKAERIVRQPALVMTPMVEGEFNRGTQVPLVISLASQDGDG